MLSILYFGPGPLELLIVLLFPIFLFLVPLWKIFVKAGKPGWACLIPIYNIIVLLEIVGKPAWWIILLILPFVNIVFEIWVANLLSLRFGKSEGFTVGLILLPYIFIPILGYGDAQYTQPA